MIRGENVVLLGEIVSITSYKRRRCVKGRRWVESLTPFSHVEFVLVDFSLLQDLDLEDEIPLRPAPWKAVEAANKAEKVKSSL